MLKRDKSFAWGLSESEEYVLLNLIDCRKRQGKDCLGIFNVTHAARSIYADMSDSLKKANTFLDAYQKTGSRKVAMDALMELSYVQGIEHVISDIGVDELAESVEDCGNYYWEFNKLWKTLGEMFDEHVERYYDIQNGDWEEETKDESAPTV